jgi:hypothetical protein
MTYEEAYLGDGVYASFDGYGIKLDTRAQPGVVGWNGTEHINEIVLEPPVYAQLLLYVQRIKEQSEQTSRSEAQPQSLQSSLTP